MRVGLERRARLAVDQLEVGVRFCTLARSQARRRQHVQARRSIQCGLSTTLHAAALVSHVRRELELELDPWHGKGNPWSSL